MSRESKCQHDIDEQETAVADHICPLCLQDKLRAAEDKLVVLEHLRKSGIKLWYEEQTRRQEAEWKYHELLYAVERKFPNESRHETALRYIHERESAEVGPAQEQTK